MSDKQDTPLTFMAVHAHPNGEMFGTDGTFARYVAQDIHTVLVTATMREEDWIYNLALNEEAQAFAAHKTQIAPNNFVFTLPEEQRKQAFGYEYFVLSHSAISAREGEMEQDMLADLD